MANEDLVRKLSRISDETPINTYRFDLTPLASISNFQLMSHTGITRLLRFYTPNGPSGNVTFQVRPVGSSTIYSVAADSDGATLLTLSANGSPRIFGAAVLSPLSSMLQGVEMRIVGPVTSNDDVYILEVY